MKDLSPSEISRIFSVAENVLNGIQMLPKLLKDELPSEYDASKNGGYLALYQRNNFIETGELIQLSKVGTISDLSDPEYGSKNQKYRKFAESKCQFIIQTPNILTSDETTFGIKGGLVINELLIIGFSGRSQFEDELLVVVTDLLFRRKHPALDDKIKQLQQKQNNPFLSDRILEQMTVFCGH